MTVARERGLDGVTLRVVADEAGVTAPALYWHFADKEALVREVTREIARLFKDEMHQPVAVAGAEARLRRSLEAFRRFAVDHPTYFDALFVRPPTSPRGTLELREGRTRPTILQMLADQVAECMRDGTMRTGDAEGVAMTLSALAQGVVILQRRGQFASDEQFAAFFDASIDRMLNGLR